MLKWALIFLVVALIAGALGVTTSPRGPRPAAPPPSNSRRASASP
jgi:hypothetical protein